MKIIYLHQYFKTPEQGGAIRSYYIAKAMVAKGFEVEMITSHQEKKYRQVNIEGINIHYLPVFYSNQSGFFGRSFSFLKFLWQSYLQAKKNSEAKLCYASSTPLTVGVTALMLKLIHGIPFIFEVRDLWPQAAIELGFVRNYFLKKALYFLEKKIYLNAEKIIVLSPLMEEYVRQSVPNKQVLCVPNMADCDFFQHKEKEAKIVQQYKVGDKFVISYLGSVSKANHLSYFLDIAFYFQKNGETSVEFIIAGEGNEWEFIESEISRLSLKNIRMIPQVDKYGIKELLNITDAVYVSFWQKKILESNSPNKFFDALASGRTVIVNTEGWLKDLVIQNECGFYADPNHPENFYLQWKELVSNPQKNSLFQNNARKLAEESFSREILTQKIIDSIKNTPLKSNP